jgi:hypothetical protein
MKPTTFSIPVFSIRRIETPYERRFGYRNFLAIVDACNLPDLSDWRQINVRDPKTRGRVPNAIRTSFTDSADEFLFMNRGLVLAADKVEFDDTAKGRSIKVIFRDPKIHGLLDGGHTYRIVRESAENLTADDARRYVRIEIITGFDRETISDVVEARNTSNQVRDESLANLRREFEPLKEVLKGHPYSDSIAWKEYEEDESGEPKPIDVRDIISYLITFNRDFYNSAAKQPLIAYKDKRACLRHFQDNRKSLQKLYPLLPDILLLWDEIHSGWHEWYNQGRKEEVRHGRFPDLTGIVQANENQAKENLYFKGMESDFRIPEAYKYPILSALRAAAQVDDGEARWATDPFQLLRENGPQLTNVVGAAIRDTHNPNKVGKDVGTWSSCYLVVESALRGTMTAEAQKKIRELEAQLAALRRRK